MLGRKLVCGDLEMCSKIGLSQSGTLIRTTRPIVKTEHNKYLYKNIVLENVGHEARSMALGMAVFVNQSTTSVLTEIF